MGSILCTHLQETTFLDDSQAVFHTPHNTKSVLLSILIDLQMSLDQRHANASIFLDLSVAFDMVHHVILLNHIIRDGLEGSELNWLQFFLCRQ